MNRIFLTGFDFGQPCRFRLFVWIRFVLSDSSCCLMYQDETKRICCVPQCFCELRVDLCELMHGLT